MTIVVTRISTMPLNYQDIKPLKWTQATGIEPVLNHLIVTPSMGKTHEGIEPISLLPKTYMKSIKPLSVCASDN